MERADPTPEEIAERCEAVQRTWSKGTERYRRTGLPAGVYDGLEIKIVAAPFDVEAPAMYDE